MKNKNLLIVLALAAFMVITPLINSVQAEPKVVVTRRSTSNGVWYTQIQFVLGGAINTIKMPDVWNGGLFVLCRGYTHTVSSDVPLDAITGMLASGYATAATNNGVGGICVKEAMIRTHQLTEYVIDNYDVTGKVYLLGISLGGNVALQLGAKYPELYDGVLEVCGAKNMATEYLDKMYYLSLTNDADLAAAIVAKGGISPPYPQTSLTTFRASALTFANDIALACGGTPEEKMQAYERISPTFSAAHISIPTISLVGTKDATVLYSESLEFRNAVAAEGNLDLYHFYKVVNGQHTNPLVNAQIPTCLNYLVNWVENGISPPPSSSP